MWALPEVSPAAQSALVGYLYIGIALFGLVLNAATGVMIASKRVYRLSAYTIMANVALADSLMLIVAGIACGGALLVAPEAPFLLQQPSANNNASGQQQPLATIAGGHAPAQGLRAASATRLSLLGGRIRMVEAAVTDPDQQDPVTGPGPGQPDGPLDFGVAFGEIASWTAGVLSYGYLGINRCVAIRFYGTRAKQLNQVWVALVASLLSWTIGFALGLGTFPGPVVGILPAMWTVGVREQGTRREALLTHLSLAILGTSVALQWICSSLVLHKIFVVRKKISRNKLGPDSANRFRKQARLTFQFFYPSLFCAVSSALHFAKPFLHRFFRLGDISLIALHLVWLLNHVCNPVIYAYFNERMRVSYAEMFSCARARKYVRRRKQKYFDNPLGMGLSARLCAFAGLPMSRLRRSMKRRPVSRSSTAPNGTIGNFVRSSLQMQSRDFEQLCEFMMRVNPLNDSSEGWRESASSSSSSSSSEEEGFWPGRKVRSEGGLLSAVEAIRRLSNQSIQLAQQPNSSSPGGQQREPSRSIVLLNLGRQAMWARFAKKGSI